MKPAEAIAQDNMSRPEAKKHHNPGRRCLACFRSYSNYFEHCSSVFVKIIGGNNKIEGPEKSIAVVPFINGSLMTVFRNQWMYTEYKKFQKLNQGFFVRVPTG
jgi:hypothetical protein